MQLEYKIVEHNNRNLDYMKAMAEMLKELNKELKEETILTICRTSNKKMINFESAGSKMNYQEADIYLLKKDAEKILHYIGINKFNIVKDEKNSILHAGQTIDYMIGNKKIATLRKSKKTNIK
mgnify:CR=1 FL=1